MTIVDSLKAKGSTGGNNIAEAINNLPMGGGGAASINNIPQLIRLWDEDDNPLGIKLESLSHDDFYSSKYLFASIGDNTDPTQNVISLMRSDPSEVKWLVYMSTSEFLYASRENLTPAGTSHNVYYFYENGDLECLFFITGDLTPPAYINKYSYNAETGVYDFISSDPYDPRNISN